MSSAAPPVVDVLRDLIRGRCVNDGSLDSGGESRNADVLEDLLRVPGVELERHAAQPGRDSLIARLQGSDPTAPTLCLMGHTDVVPANPEGWRRDPYAAELVDGVVWGRGAVDMLNLTSAMAVAVRRLAESGWRPRGSLVFLGVADEEAGGELGAGHLLREHRDAVAADFVVTESGGVPVDTPAGQRLWVTVGEKGVAWSRLRVRGTPGHGSRPLRTDNALVKAAEVVLRLAAHRPTAQISQVWRRFVEGMAFPPDLAARLLDPARVADALDVLPLSEARLMHAGTHMTISPNVCHGGTKANVIPDRVDLEVDIRLLPGQTLEDVEATLRDALGGLRDEVEWEVVHHAPASVSPVDTPLWEAITRACARLAPEATCIPTLTVGGTDARFFRELGVPAYGFGLFSRRMTLEQFSAMFHGNDERIDVESLDLSTQLFEALARDLCG